jgi:hypothetical protein
LDFCVQKLTTKFTKGTKVLKRSQLVENFVPS